MPTPIKTPPSPITQTQTGGGSNLLSPVTGTAALSPLEEIEALLSNYRNGTPPVAPVRESVEDKNKRVYGNTIGIGLPAAYMMGREKPAWLKGRRYKGTTRAGQALLAMNKKYGTPKPQPRTPPKLGPPKPTR